jgi:hypothetical protein
MAIKIYPCQFLYSRGIKLGLYRIDEKKIIIIIQNPAEVENALEKA